MKPYVPDSLPLNNIDWGSHVSLIGEANRLLATYGGTLMSVINPGVLLSPLATQEAVLSSRIEGTQASFSEVLQYEASPKDPIDPVKEADIHEIINYRKAMGHAVEYLKNRPFCLNMVKELHAILLDSVRGRNKDPGNFRRVQNYIGPPSCTEENATFVPPSADKLMPALDNWEKYIHFDEKDPLVQLAVVKAQFELLHPFLDGNGRIGRMLIPIFLYEKGILPSPTFYMSGFFEEHRDSYFDHLSAISRKQDWDGWIEFFLVCVARQADINTHKTYKIMTLYNRMKNEIPEITNSKYAIKAIDAIFSQPHFNSSDFIINSEIPYRSAMVILNKLKDNNVIDQLAQGKGKRPAVWAFTKLVKITETND
jgi:cell filamentation protein, protein adenylyltransferase